RKERAPADHEARERRELAIAAPVLTARTRNGLTTGVVVAPEERFGLVVVAAAAQDADRLGEVLLELELHRFAEDVPSVAVEAHARAGRRQDRLDEVLAAQRERTTRTIVRVVLEGVLPGGRDHDAAVGVVQKTVLQGARQHHLRR